MNAGIYSLIKQCSLQCEFCPLWQIPEAEQTYLPAKEVITDLKTLARPGMHLHLGGGDPLLYPNLAELLREVRSHFASVWLYTSGILYEAQAEALRPVVDELCLVFNHPQAEDNNRIAGTAHFKLLTSAVRIAQAVGQPVRLVLLTHCESALFLPEAEELAQSLDVTLELRPVHQYLYARLTKETVDFIRRYQRVKNVELWPGELKPNRRGAKQCAGLPFSGRGWGEQAIRRWRKI